MPVVNEILKLKQKFDVKLIQEFVYTALLRLIKCDLTLSFIMDAES